MTRALLEQALDRGVDRGVDRGGAHGIRLLLADGLYAAGPLLAWLTYAKGSDALVRLPAERDLYADITGLARTGTIPWRRQTYTRVVRGHKDQRTVEVAAVDELTTWDSFVAAATS